MSGNAIKSTIGIQPLLIPTTTTLAQIIITSSLTWIKAISLPTSLSISILAPPMKVKVAQSCPTLYDPVGYTVHGILQARILEWVAFPFPRGDLPNPGIKPRSPALQEDSLPTEPTREAQNQPGRNQFLGHSPNLTRVSRELSPTALRQ